MMGVKKSSDNLLRYLKKQEVGFSILSYFTFVIIANLFKLSSALMNNQILHRATVLGM